MEILDRPINTRFSNTNNVHCFSFNSLSKINNDFESSINRIRNAINEIDKDKETSAISYKGLFSMITSLLDFYLHQVACCINKPLVAFSPNKLNLRMRELKVSFSECLSIYNKPKRQDQIKRTQELLEKLLFKDPLQGDWGICSFSKWIGIDVSYNEKDRKYILNKKDNSSRDEDYIKFLNLNVDFLKNLRKLRNPGVHQFFVDRESQEESVMSKDELIEWCDKAKNFQNGIHEIINNMFNDNGSRK